MAEQKTDATVVDETKKVDSSSKKNNKKTIIWVVVIITVVICICCAISGVVAGKGASKLAKQSNEVKSELLIDMCKNEGIVTRSEYRAWFSSDFRSTNSMMDAADALDELFPEDMVCDDLYVDGLIDLFKKKQTFAINVSSGGTVANLTYPVSDSENVTVNLVKVDSDWKLDSYSTLTH